MKSNFVEINGKYYNKTLIKKVQLVEYKNALNKEEGSPVCALYFKLLGENENLFENFLSIEEGEKHLHALVD